MLRDDLDCLRLASDLTRLASYVPSSALKAHILQIARTCTGMVDRPPSGGPGTDVVPVAVAHLRCTAAAATQLRDAIDKALLIGAPVQNPEGKAN